MSNSLRLSRARRGIALLAALAALTGCATAAPAAESAEAAPRMIALPRVEVRFDEDGMPSVGGVSARLLESLTFGAFQASSVQIDRAWIEYFQSTDVQHIEVLQNDEGVFAWLNGRRLPNLVWNARELSNSAQLAERLGVLETLGLSPNAASFLQRAAPTLRRFAVDVLVRFPTRPGTPEIAARDASAAVTALPRRPQTDAERTLDVAVRYDPQGDPWPEGITDEEFRRRLGFDVMTLALQPEFIERLSSRGLRDFTLRSEADGLRLQVNGVSLPALQCDVRCLVDLGDVIATLNTYPDMEHLNAPIRTLTPSLRTIDAHITLHFPGPNATDAVARSAR
jgi:hypothetical protein